MTPKVNNTQKHSDSQGEHIVCEGKLVLLKNKKPPADVYVDGKYGRHPIIISETEEIEVGDEYLEDNKFINTCNSQKEADTINENILKGSKILALPEHFSNKNLQSIVDGRVKDGDELLIKCAFCVSYQTKAPDIEWDRIHLNKRKHITLFY